VVPSVNVVRAAFRQIVEHYVESAGMNDRESMADQGSSLDFGEVEKCSPAQMRSTLPTNHSSGGGDFSLNDLLRRIRALNGTGHHHLIKPVVNVGGRYQIPHCRLQ
jgi:hypothetical protein